MSIAVGIAISRMFDWRVIRSQFGFIQDMGGDVKFIVRGVHGRPLPIPEARNQIVAQVLKEKHEWLLFFDSDATAAWGTLPRLLSWKVPVVSALCFKRKRPVTPACGICNHTHGVYFNPSPVDAIADWLGHYGQLLTAEATILPTAPEDSLMAVDVMGTHCTLIHRSVLEAIPEPHFVRITPPEFSSTGSDYDFCIKAKKAGFPVYVDRSVVSGHLEGTRELAGIDFMAWTTWSRWMKRNIPQTDLEEIEP